MKKPLLCFLAFASLGFAQSVDVGTLVCPAVPQPGIYIPVSINNVMYCMKMDPSFLLTLPTPTTPGVIALNNTLPSGVLYSYVGPGPLPPCGVAPIGLWSLAIKTTAGASDILFWCRTGPTATGHGPQWVQISLN